MGGQNLSNFFKTAASAGAALALVVAGVTSATPARAAGALTLAEWNATQGAIDLHSAMAKADNYMNSLNGMDLTVHIETSGSSFGNSTTEDTQVSATKTSAVANYAIADTITGEHNSFKFYFANGTYLESIVCFQSGDSYVNDSTQTLKRLGKPTATAVNDHTATTPAGLINISPSNIWSPSTQDPLGGVAGPSSTLTYSEVTQTTDVYGPGSKQFYWTASFALSGQLLVTLSADENFNSDGLATSMTLEEHAPGGLFDMVLSTTQAVADNSALLIPSAQQTVDATAFIAMGHKIDAEASVMPKAKAIAAKAKALAKAAKKSLAASQIVAAAKALKAKVVSVKNGVKLTGKASGVSGSVCVTAVKGAATIAPCK